MKKAFIILLVLSQAVMAEDFNLSTPYSQKLKLKPFISGGLKLGEVSSEDCNCDEPETILQGEITSVQESLGSGRALRDFYRTKLPKHSNRKVTVEIITPAFKKGKQPQLRSTLHPVNLTPIVANLRSPIAAYSEEQINKLVIANTPKGANESSIDYSTRIHAAVTAMFASKIGEKNPKAALSYIEARSKGKSFRYKIHFLSQILDRMYDNYDFKMPNGEVSQKSLYQEMNKDNMGTGSKTSKRADVAGVCRHMHQLALKMARKMGLKMSYGISYPTTTGYHLNLIVSNPMNPSETIRFNYDSIETIEGAEGSGALAQSKRVPINSGISFHVWDENDKPLYYLPNQKGIVLERMSGGDIRLFDPNIAPDSGTTRATYNLSGHQLNVFHALNPEYGDNGEHVAGVSYYTDVPISKHFSAEVGGALYYSRAETVHQDYEVTGSPGQRVKFYDVNQTAGFYLRAAIKGEYDLTKRLKLDSSLILRGTGYHSSDDTIFETSMNGNITFSASDEASNFLGDGNGSIITNLTFNRTPKSRTQLQLDVSGQSGDITATQGASLYLRRATLFHHERFRIGSGNLLMDGSLNYVPLNEGVNPVIFSTRAAYQNGSKSREVFVGYTGSLNPSSTPAFISGGRPTVSTGISQSLGSDNQFSIGFNLALSPGLTMTGEREVSIMSPNQDNLLDTHVYVPGEGVQRRVNPHTQHLPEAQQQKLESETRRYKIDVPMEFHGGIYFRGHF